MQALASGHKPLIAHAALTYIYYWYNFMPLARGTAVTGYITLLAIFLAADMPISSFIPKVCNWLCLVPKMGNGTPFISLGVCISLMHHVQIMQYVLQLGGMQLFMHQAKMLTEPLRQQTACKV